VGLREFGVEQVDELLVGDGALLVLPRVGERGGFLERQPQPLAPGHEPQPFDVRLAVEAVPGGCARRWWQQPLVLVVAQRRRREPGDVGDVADPVATGHDVCLPRRSTPSAWVRPGSKVWARAANGVFGVAFNAG
jgi:hypothetical protein